MKKWSLLRLSNIWLTILGAFLVGFTLVVFWATSLMRTLTSEAVREARNMEISATIHLQLLEYQRLMRDAHTRGEPRLQEDADRAHERIRELIARASATTQSSEGRAALTKAEEDIAAYFRHCSDVEMSDGNPETIVDRTLPHLYVALSSLANLRARNAERLARTTRKSDELAWVFRGISIAGAGLALLVLLICAWGVRRNLLEPVLELERAIRDFQRGRRHVAVSESGPAEISSIAVAFNGMREALERERRERLGFAAGVAHDLRTPLNVIQMGVATLEMSEVGEDPTTRSILSRVLRQTANMTRMVDDLVDTSHIESGEFSAQFETIDLRSVVESVVDSYRTVSADHVIKTCLPDEPVMVLADEGRLEQVVSNLLGNAIKYSPGGGEVRLDVEGSEEWSVVAVEDTGIGIDGEELGALFTPFHREPRAQEVSGGAGLGLSIVRRIVESFHGEVEVDSEVGVGTTFRVRFPRAQCPVDDRRLDARKSSPAHTSSASRVV